ncbi:hypothetical protein [Streptococcus uberis]|uniref:hypothetical protein n=1 Tax=Streptococcus uberis TaxID=1349 RepID=UPI0027DB8A92|nr:hypothetical protein [Streptococcus uberis]MCK1235479.1 hypothetical protein [Streptococcus uberis]
MNKNQIKQILDNYNVSDSENLSNALNDILSGLYSDVDKFKTDKSRNDLNERIFGKH